MSDNATTNGRPALLVTHAPHRVSGDDVARIMWEVNLALVPALIMALATFGFAAAVVVIACVVGAVLGEVMTQGWLRGRKVTLGDGSAVLTGLLLAFCVPAALPWWVALIGGWFATVIGKQVFGGLGQNIFNPAHVARAILLASWPVFMTTWLKPGWLFSVPADAMTQATPLGVLKEAVRNPELANQLAASGTPLVQHVFTRLQIGWSDLLIGSIGGSLGETSKIALLLGGVFLLIRGHISWHVPVTMAGTVFVGATLAGGSVETGLFHLLSGGLTIGAIFMATDMVTCPMTRRGQLLFGLGCGLITLLIRLKGGYPEGVCYSILIMNSVVPLIDRAFVPKKFGAVAPPVEAKA